MTINAALIGIVGEALIIGVVLFVAFYIIKTTPKKSSSASHTVKK